MFCIQYRDLEEGNLAMWHELSNTRHKNRVNARIHLGRLRETDDKESLMTYRIVEVDSNEYYSRKYRSTQNNNMNTCKCNGLSKLPIINGIVYCSKCELRQVN